jgi:ankyrin repeat protein
LRFDCVKLFIDHGAKCNISNPRTRWSPIHWCAKYSDHETIKLLIDQDCDAHLPDKNNIYPVDLAGYYNSPKTARMLIIHVLKQIK